LTSFERHWVPAFAGMTARATSMVSRLRGNDGKGNVHGFPPSRE
jgi:hypothetical protein